MESTTTSSGIDLAKPTARPGLGLSLALLSIPGSTIAWDLFDGAGFLIGLPLAIAAIVLGVQARQRSETGRGKAIAAIVIGALVLLQMAIWTVLSAF
jgi:hypothetical protein